MLTVAVRAEGRRVGVVTMSSNQDLQARRQASVPRGVSSATQIFAAKADNAELWDVVANAISILPAAR